MSFQPMQREISVWAEEKMKPNSNRVTIIRSIYSFY